MGRVHQERFKENAYDRKKWRERIRAKIAKAGQPAIRPGVLLLFVYLIIDTQKQSSINLMIHASQLKIADRDVGCRLHVEVM